MLSQVNAIERLASLMTGENLRTRAVSSTASPSRNKSHVAPSKEAPAAALPPAHTGATHGG